MNELICRVLSVYFIRFFTKLIISKSLHQESRFPELVYDPDFLMGFWDKIELILLIFYRLCRGFYHDGKRVDNDPLGTMAELMGVENEKDKQAALKISP